MSKSNMSLQVFMVEDVR